MTPTVAPVTETSALGPLVVRLPRAVRTGGRRRNSGLRHGDARCEREREPGKHDQMHGAGRDGLTWVESGLSLSPSSPHVEADQPRSWEG
jgi:hypothetical protein